MQAYIRGVEQKFDFESKRSLTFVLFDLPSGKTLRAQVEDIEELSELIDAGLESQANTNPEPDLSAQIGYNKKFFEEEQRKLVASFDTGNDDSFVKEDEDSLVSWQEEDQIPEHMKAALSYLDVPAVVEEAALRELLETIESEWSESDWEHIASIDQSSERAEPAEKTPPHAPLEAPTPKPAVLAQQAIPTGQVTWADGTPVVPSQRKRAKTVPKDEYGYPIVSSQSPQTEPTMAINEDTDEFGVSQI